jgi:hypothetical protein
MILWSPHQLGEGCFYNGHPRAKDAFKVCPTPDPCLVVEGQRHKRFPGWRTKNQIINSSYCHKNSPDQVQVTRLPTTLDAFNAIPRRVSQQMKSELEIYCDQIITAVRFSVSTSFSGECYIWHALAPHTTCTCLALLVGNNGRVLFDISFCCDLS